MFKWFLGALAALVTVACQGADVGVSYLYKLKDVAVGSQTDGQALVWSSSMNRWIPGAGGGGGSSTNLLENWATTNALAPEIVWDPTTHFLTITCPAGASGGIGGGIIMKSNNITTVAIGASTGLGDFTDVIAENTLHVTGDTYLLGQIKRINGVLYSTWPSSLTNGGILTDTTGSGDLRWATNFDAFTVTNLTVITNNVSVLNVSQTIKVNGKAATVFSVNGTEMAIANLTNSATVTFNVSGTNITATATSSGGTSVYVNGTNVSGPNFKDTSDITYALGASTNVQPSFAAQSWNALSYSGTNVTLDASLGNSQAAHYKLALTGAAWMTTPTSIPAVPKMYYVWYQQPSTGTVSVGFTNAGFKFPGGVAPVVDTNANAQTLVVFMTGPFTNSVLNYMGIVPQIQ